MKKLLQHAKKITISLVLLMVLTLSFSFIACKQEPPLVIKESDTYFVINVSSSQMELKDDTTLIEYMDSLKQNGLLNFETSGGMIVSINGIENPSDWSSCWMLYTSDTDFSNESWGKINYNGTTYGSAMFGAETLVIKEGCIYIWVFKAF